MEDCRLVEGDCLDVLKTLPAGSVDAVVTDPPYGQTNEAYDSPVAFRPDVWQECYRLAGENAALLSFTGSPTYHRIASAIEAGGWRVRQMWAWVYRDGMITSAYPREGFDRLAPAMDPIVFATKGKVLLKLSREGRPWVAWHEKKPGDAAYSERSRVMSGVDRASGHWPRTIVAEANLSSFDYFALPRTSGKYRHERAGHPNQKPLALMRWLVAKLPGGTVLDPFMGSGTTAVACLREGRRFVGIEKVPEYVEIARRRVGEERARLPLLAGGA